MSCVWWRRASPSWWWSNSHAPPCRLPPRPSSWRTDGSSRPGRQATWSRCSTRRISDPFNPRGRVRPHTTGRQITSTPVPEPIRNPGLEGRHSLKKAPPYRPVHSTVIRNSHRAAVPAPEAERFGPQGERPNRSARGGRLGEVVQGGAVHRLGREVTLDPR